jgi:hypothetical protein
VRKAARPVNQKGTFIDAIYEWFLPRNRFWTLVSVATFCALVMLEAFFIVVESTDPQIRQKMIPLVLSLMLTFVLSIFWRGSIQSFLSIAGTGSMYFGMVFILSTAAGHHGLQPVIASRLGVGKVMEPVPPVPMANLYFLMGILGMALCMAISFKPSLFRIKGPQFKLPYPVWTGLEPSKSGSSAMLIPVQGLLNPTERHLIAKYRYIVVKIGGTAYFVSPDDWVPQGSFVVRDIGSGSLLGIPKLPDGFNMW